ncbi:MAG TPA: recombinase family protein [Pseudonocardiaceae bacterium]
MRAALYARVSTERQAERGTIGSQLQLLREHLAEAGDELVDEYLDDGHSGARLDRPGLDALRDSAEGGLFERVWCLSPDRLARAYAYQVLVLDELARFGVTVAFTDSPALAADDPQATLLTQVQGVIAEYERAKIAERYRRGKLFRARTGEITTWKTAYGYRRIPRSAATGPAHWEIYEPEAAVVRRIFSDRAAGTTVREICRRLNADRVPSPTGKPTWGTSTLLRLLRNEAYIGRVYYNRTESVPARHPTHHSRQVPRDRDEWIPITCPRIVTDEVFEAAGRVASDNSKWSPRRAEPGEWLLKGLVKCGVCGVGTNCHKMRGRNGTRHRYYYCRNHDPIRAGGQDRRCPERNIRADALDTFVFDQIRIALTQPELLLAGEQAVAMTTPIPDDELLAAELTHLDRKIDNADAERRRLVDIYQAGLIDLTELQRRAGDVAARQRDLQTKRTSLADQRSALARGNQLRRRITDFATQVRQVIDQLDNVQKQQLLRLLVEEIKVTGWHVQIRLRIALDPPGPDPQHPGGPTDRTTPPTQTHPMSTEDRLRSIADHQRRLLPHARSPKTRRQPTQKTLNYPRGVRTSIRPPARTATWPLTLSASLVSTPWPDSPTTGERAAQPSAGDGLDDL